jgi:hypothetical protein
MGSPLSRSRGSQLRGQPKFPATVVPGPDYAAHRTQGRQALTHGGGSAPDRFNQTLRCACRNNRTSSLAVFDKYLSLFQAKPTSIKSVLDNGLPIT